MHNLQALVFTAEAQADADGVFEFDVPVGMTIWGISACVEAYSGAGAAADIDIQDDGTDVITELEFDTAGTPGTWLTPALGGLQTPVTIAAGSDVEIDLNLNSDTADFTVVLYVTLDEV